jgi:hypothetical protein
VVLTNQSRTGEHTSESTVHFTELEFCVYISVHDIKSR